MFFPLFVCHLTWDIILQANVRDPCKLKSLHFSAALTEYLGAKTVLHKTAKNSGVLPKCVVR